MEETRQPDSVEATQNGRSDLTTLAFSLVAFFFLFWLFMRLQEVYLYRQWNQSSQNTLNRFLSLGDVAYPLRGLLLLSELVVLVWLFRPALRRPIAATGRAAPREYLPINWVLGISGGLGGFVITIPVLWSARAAPFLDHLLAGRPPTPARIMTILLFALFLPAATELVFRGIVQARLHGHMSAPAAILVSAVLDACVWSVFNFGFALVLGFVCGALFWWRRSLMPAVVADIVMTVSAGSYVLFRIW